MFLLRKLTKVKDLSVQTILRYTAAPSILLALNESSCRVLPIVINLDINSEAYLHAAHASIPVNGMDVILGRQDKAQVLKRIFSMVSSGTL